MPTIHYSDDGGAIDVDRLEAMRREAGFSPLARETILAQIAGSRWVSAAWDGERLIGFVRAISDGATNAYICTMVVDAAYRRRGIGAELVRRLIGDRDGIRWVLHSRDETIAFYERLGFALADNMMRRDRRSP